MKTNNNKIQAARLKTLEKVLKDQHLEMILVCSSLQEFSFGFALTSIKPIIYHYFFIRKSSRATEGNRLEHGFFVPYFLTERLGLTSKHKVITFDDNKVSEDMAELLKGKNRVGILGPAPAAHFSQSRAELVFLDEQLWPMLMQKTGREINKIKEVSAGLNKVLRAIPGQLKEGTRLDKIAEFLDKQILQEADDLAFPSLVESRHGQHNLLSLLGFKAKIHHQDLLYINVGAEKDGFFADAGRSYFQNNKKLEKQYARMEKAFLAFAKTLKPGLKLSELSAIMTRQLKAAGLERARLRDEYLGHAVGFSIINLPFIGKNLFPEAKLVAGSTWSIVVQCEIDGEFLQIQDTLMIKARGGAEILTRAD